MHAHANMRMLTLRARMCARRVTRMWCRVLGAGGLRNPGGGGDAAAARRGTGGHVRPSNAPTGDLLDHQTGGMGQHACWRV
eukprot:359066-Chlamydomonas_euryale.AAC.2